MDILDNYNNIPESGQPDNRPKEEIIEKIIHPLGIYNASGVLLGYTWNKDDNLTLTINNLDEVLARIFEEQGRTYNMSDYLAQSYYEINVFDIRGDKVTSHSVPAEHDFRLPVRELELESNNYDFEIRVINNKILKQSGQSGESGDADIFTLIDKGRYTLFVK